MPVPPREGGTGIRRLRRSRRTTKAGGRSRGPRPSLFALYPQLIAAYGTAYVEWYPTPSTYE